MSNTPPQHEQPRDPTPSPLRPLLPLALTVAGCYVGGIFLFLFVLPGWRALPRRFAYAEAIACLSLMGVGYVLSLVLGVLFTRRITQSAAERTVLYVLLACYALGFPPFALMGANFAGH